jgi:AcrR family transcriptional regulator
MKSAKSTEDPRVLRTRSALREALVSSILERGWDATSIGDVCARARVGRSTFYTHFADKEELLQSGFRDLRRLLRAELGKSGATSRGLAFSRGLFEHAYENRRLFRALLGKRSGQAIQKQFLQFVAEMTEEELAPRLPTGIERDATVQYLAGAFNQLVVWWLEHRKPLAPRDVDALFQRLTLPLLTSNLMRSS